MAHKLFTGCENNRGRAAENRSHTHADIYPSTNKKNSRKILTHPKISMIINWMLAKMMIAMTIGNKHTQMWSAHAHKQTYTKLSCRFRCYSNKYYHKVIDAAVAVIFFRLTHISIDMFHCSIVACGHVAADCNDLLKCCMHICSY